MKTGKTLSELAQHVTDLAMTSVWFLDLPQVPRWLRGLKASVLSEAPKTYLVRLDPDQACRHQGGDLRVAKALVTQTNPHAKSDAAIVSEFAALLDQHAQAADLDAGFDAGEFSGPEHGRMLEKAIEEFRRKNDLSETQIARLLNEGVLR